MQLIGWISTQYLPNVNIQMGWNHSSIGTTEAGARHKSSTSDYALSTMYNIFITVSPKGMDHVVGTMVGYG